GERQIRLSGPRREDATPSIVLLGYPPVPFKVNADRRRHIPRQRDRVMNWSEYDAGLRQRGSLTVWFSDEAIAAWRAEPRTTRGGPPHCSALAITTALTLRVVFRLALRQTEGLITQRRDRPLSSPRNFPRFPPENEVRSGLSAGGRWIRTIGPRHERA